MGTQGKLKMARTLSKISLILIPFLCLGSPTAAKNWRYWPNIGCFEFNFERTVFFELTNEATRLSAIAGSELPAIVNTSVVPASDNELQLQHILAGSIKNSTTNRPEECIISCNATGFAYAGLQDGNRCLCMNEPPTAITNGSNCDTPCPGNANFSCGGSWTMDLPQNPAYHSTNLTYIGCFKNTFNDLDRMLFEGTYNNFQNNTPEWCVTYCTAGGYDYAGLQYSSQCICSNSGPQGNSDESQCTYGCAGDSSITTCGGLGYINIFHTDAHKSTIDDYGCGNTAQDTYYQRWFEDMGHCNISTTPTTAPPAEPTEARIVGTAASSELYGAKSSHLIDGLGYQDGRYSYSTCSHVNNNDAVHWYSLELDAPHYVKEVQIARREDQGPNTPQGRNVRITIGPSREYDAAEPLCLPQIDHLTGTGLHSYPCTGPLQKGKFVKISRPGPETLTMCEVKVIVMA